MNICNDFSGKISRSFPKRTPQLFTAQSGRFQGTVLYPCLFTFPKLLQHHSRSPPGLPQQCADSPQNSFSSGFQSQKISTKLHRIFIRMDHVIMYLFQIARKDIQLNFLFYLNILAYSLWENLEYAKIHILEKIRSAFNNNHQKLLRINFTKCRINSSRAGQR